MGWYREIRACAAANRPCLQCHRSTGGVMGRAALQLALLARLQPPGPGQCGSRFDSKLARHLSELRVVVAPTRT